MSSPDVAHRYREQGWWRDATFSDDLRQAAREKPDRLALLTWRQRENRLVPLTFGEFDGRVDSVAAAMHDLGVHRGDVVAFQLPAWWETAVLIFACLRAGVIAAPIPLQFGVYESERALAGTGAAVCVVPDEWDGVPYARRLEKLAERLPELRHRIVIGDAAATSAVSLDAAFRDRRPAPSATCRPLAADDVCAVLFSSGTTGDPHLVVRSANTLHAGSLKRASSDAKLHATTTGMTFISGYRRLLRVPYLGVPTLFSDDRDPGHWLDLVERAAVTQLWTTPYVLRAMGDEQRLRTRDLSSLRSISSAGGPLTQEAVSEARKRLCPTVLNVWGMTECANEIGTTGDDPPDRAGWSLGRMEEAGQVRLEATDPAFEQDTFRLCVRGPGVALATIARDSGRVLWSAADDDGWLDTGDLVTPDGAGGLRLLGRAVERIGNPGQIPVADVEHALLSHPDVEDVALVPWPGADGRESACAVVVSSLRPDLQELCAHLTEQGLGDLHLPALVAYVDDLGRTEQGKVRRKALLEKVRAGDAALGTIA